VIAAMVQNPDESAVLVAVCYPVEGFQIYGTDYRTVDRLRNRGVFCRA
jgi:hypothetical protein